MTRLIQNPLVCFAMMMFVHAARGDVTVTISDMHICCKGCSSAIEKAAAKVPAVKCAASEDSETTTLTADKKEAGIMKTSKRLPGRVLNPRRQTGGESCPTKSSTVTRPTYPV